MGCKVKIAIQDLAPDLVSVYSSFADEKEFAKSMTNEIKHYTDKDVSTIIG